jgi:uncharacterized FlaG/YvyC family protein
MDLTAINSVASGAHVPAAAVTVDKTAEKREVVQAIKAVNGTEMFGADNVLRFQKDPETNRFVVRVVSKKTGEVLSQVPEEYLLRLAEDIKRTG